MAVGAPCVEGEHGAENAEANECHREKECLPAVADSIVLGNLENVPCKLSAFGSAMVVYADEAEHQECRSTHEHKGELHGRVVLAAGTPDTDEKIHGDKGDFIEHEHREEVDADEEAEHAGGKEDEPEEEFLGLLDFPGGEGSCQNNDGRKENHCHRDSVDTHGEVDVKRSEPAPAVDKKHGGIGCRTQCKILYQEADRQCCQGQRAYHGHGADGPRVAIVAQPDSEEHHQGDDHEVNENI